MDVHRQRQNLSRYWDNEMTDAIQEEGMSILNKYSLLFYKRPSTLDIHIHTKKLLQNTFSDQFM